MRVFFPNELIMIPKRKNKLTDHFWMVITKAPNHYFEISQLKILTMHYSVICLQIIFNGNQTVDSEKFFKEFRLINAEGML